MSDNVVLGDYVVTDVSFGAVLTEDKNLQVGNKEVYKINKQPPPTQIVVYGRRNHRVGFRIISHRNATRDYDVVIPTACKQCSLIVTKHRTY